MITLSSIVKVSRSMKTPKPVNRQRLAQAIEAAEANGPLPNRQQLYASVCERYNVACGPSNAREWITPSIVLLRIAEWQITIKTPIGKRGRPAGTKLAPKLDANGNPLPRAKRKGRNRRPPNELMEKLRKQFDHPQYEGMLSRIENGSLAARVQANCLSCAGNAKSEIKFCQCNDCVWYDIRPYQEKTIDVQPALAYALPIVTL